MTAFSIRRACASALLVVLGGAAAYSIYSFWGLATRRRWIEPREEVREVVVPPGMKVEGVSWRETDLWLLTRPARPGETVGTIYILYRPLGWAVVRTRFSVREQEEVGR